MLSVTKVEEFLCLGASERVYIVLLQVLSQGRVNILHILVPVHSTSGVCVRMCVHMRLCMWVHMVVVVVLVVMVFLVVVLVVGGSSSGTAPSSRRPRPTIARTCKRWGRELSGIFVSRAMGAQAVFKVLVANRHNYKSAA